MLHIKFFKNISKADVAIAGGKGASLGEMTQAKIPVPPGFVVLASAFDKFLEAGDLKDDIRAQLKKVNPEDINSVDRASAVIRDMIHDRTMPKDLEKEIVAAYEKLFSPTTPRPSSGRRGNDLVRHSKDGWVAVRSSATAEDSAVASWAGELETFLNTDRKNLLENVKKCWSSLFTPRAIFYRHEKKLIDHYVSVAVVVQKMIQSDVSGIAFTVHPVTEDPDQMIIEAGYGLGEAIVGGMITPDSYVVDKKELSLLDVNISVQLRKLIRSQKSQSQSKSKSQSKKIKTKIEISVEVDANEWIKVNNKIGSKQKLSGKQIVELAKICYNIEKHYGFPCDIEWAFEKGKFYITQSRPITTLARLKQIK